MAHKLGIYVCAGSTGSGKTTWLADRGLWLLRDNYRTFKRGKGNLPMRRLASNIHFAPWVEEKYSEQIIYWKHPRELVGLRDVDILWDELATDLDSTQYQYTPLDLKRFLQQHRKRGITIYGTVQDFPMLDIAMRRLVHRLRYAIKIIGSRDLAANMPAPRFLWGVIFLWEVDRRSFQSNVEEYKMAWIWPELLFISKKLTSAFDTTQEIEAGEMPEVQHIERKCKVCGKLHPIHR